eukprot:scaffold1555_cov66-Phaeocystis_antarctica.AAC.1
MSGKRSWGDANAACLAAGLQLATVQSVTQDVLLLAAAAGNHVWTGGTDAASEGAWVWSPSNKPLSYTNWNGGEPNGGGTENCLMKYNGVFDGSWVGANFNGKWNDQPCTSLLNFVCQPPPESSPFNVAEFTLRLELKANSWSTSPYPHLVDDPENAITLHGLGPGYGANLGKIGFYPKVASGEGAYERGGVELISTSPWSTGTWHTLVLRKTQTHVCLFKDGVEDGCDTFTAINTDIAIPGHLQLSVPGTATYELASYRFDGELRNLEIFPCALSSPTAAGCITSPFPTDPAATSNPVASSNCGFDAAQGYQSATNGGSCFIRDASNMPVVVDYTAFRYTTYSFTIQMLENGQTPTKNNDVSPHGGIKICNTDGTSQTRGTSPELWFIDRAGDFGYGLYNGGWGPISTAEMRSVSNGLWPDAPRVWEIVMEWDGASYKLVSWKVDGTAIPSIAGQISGCGADTSAAGQVRVWTYNGADTFKVKDFTVTQGPSLSSRRLSERADPASQVVARPVNGRSSVAADAMAEMGLQVDEWAVVPGAGRWVRIRVQTVLISLEFYLGGFATEEGVTLSNQKTP